MVGASISVLKFTVVKRRSLKLKLQTFETSSRVLNQFLFLAGPSTPIPNFGYGPMVMLMTLIPTTTKRFNNWPLTLVMLFTRSTVLSLTRSTPQTFTQILDVMDLYFPRTKSFPLVKKCGPVLRLLSTRFSKCPPKRNKNTFFITFVIAHNTYREYCDSCIYDISPG